MRFFLVTQAPSYRLNKNQGSADQLVFEQADGKLKIVLWITWKLFTVESQCFLRDLLITGLFVVENI